MTNAEFHRQYQMARSKTSVISLKTMTEVKSIYIEASKIAAERIRDAELRNLSSLTDAYWNGVKADLRQGIIDMNGKIVEATNSAIGSCADIYTDITKAFLLANAKNEFVTESGINSLALSMNRGITESIARRVFNDGYTFSQRVWANGEYFQEVIKEIVARGVSIGRDPAKIAQDIQQYTVDGNIALAKRWANLSAYTPEWTKRLPKSIDWRAVRLVRSEIQMSIQQAGIDAGDNNVASTGEYKWLLGPGLAHCDTCLDYSMRTFTKETIPDYPHSNCVEKGTLIDTPNGKVEVEKLSIGDSIISHNGEVNIINRTWKNHYDGEMIGITTESGKTVWVTPDHPLLKESEFVSAKSLNLGDNIVCVSGNVTSRVFAEGETHNSPSEGLKKRGFFNVKLLLSPTGMPITTVNFNGKLYIFERKINIESVESEIWKSLISSEFEGIVHKLFVNRIKFTLPSNSALNKFFNGALRSTNGVMARFGDSNSTVCVRTGISLGDGWDCIAVHNEMSVDSGTLHSELFGYLVNREVLVSEQFVNDALFNVINDTHNERIVQLQRKRINADVYNLSIGSTQTYIANGIVSHNCGCVPELVLRDHDEFVNQLSDWVKGDINSENRYIELWYQQNYKPAQIA